MLTLTRQLPVSGSTNFVANGRVMDFTSKVVIITGASSGIGAATAKLFAAHGALLTIIGRRADRLQSVSDACEAAKGLKPLCLLLDLTTNGTCEEIVTKTVNTYGRIDILINCAGKAVMTSLFDTTMEAFDEIMTLNLRVPYKLTQLCVPHLAKTKGNIVNVFGAPMRTRPGFLPFAMAGHALEKFTRSGAGELSAVGVRMNAVRPGITRTNFLENLNVESENFDTVYACLSQTEPNLVVIEPEEIAKMIVFTASGTCPNLNASCICVDGAASLN